MTDAELVRATQSGDHAAYTALMAGAHGMVYALCYRITCSVPDAEELAHEAFVEAYLKLDQLRQPAKFRPWLRAVALNLCRMWCRQQERCPVELDDETIGMASDQEAETSVDRALYGLSELPPAHRMARMLIVHKLMVRPGGEYRLTPLGEAVWRVERYVKEHYLAGQM
jgi:RNA polymerase sigma factor (sigma-70 family)